MRAHQKRIHEKRQRLLRRMGQFDKQRAEVPRPVRPDKESKRPVWYCAYLGEKTDTLTCAKGDFGVYACTHEDAGGLQVLPTVPSCAAARAEINTDASKRRYERCNACKFGGPYDDDEFIARTRSDIAVATWPVIVTTSPRTKPTLERMLESLDAAGFAEPLIYCDGTVEVSERYEVVGRETTIGAWPSWLAALRELMDRWPDENGYIVLQDDIVFTQHLAAYVSATYPVTSSYKGPPLLQLGTNDCYVKSKGYFKWQRIDKPKELAGAQAFVFPSQIAWQLISNPAVSRYRKEPYVTSKWDRAGTHYIDQAVGTWAHKHNIPLYVHKPSLTGHIGETSVMYPNNPSNKRRTTNSFVGEDYDLMEHLKGHGVDQKQTETDAQQAEATVKRNASNEANATYV